MGKDINIGNDKFNTDNIELVEPINWNEIEDEEDLSIWNRLTSQFWLDTKIPLSSDLKSWGTLTDKEKTATSKVFAGLTVLDTLQSSVGAISLIPDAQTAHEAAIYTNIAFMESVHAKSYSSIFSTLLSTKEIKEIFRWAKENDHIKRKEAIIQYYYKGNDPEKKKIASTILESFLFYSGFYMPLHWSSQAKLTNTADIIRLIIRDESIHGYMIGNKFQKAYKKATPERQKELYEFTINLLEDLFDNEIKYTESIYDELGLTEDVIGFMKYNGNKTLNNLGFEGIFKDSEIRFSAGIMSQLNPASGETHDFFSGSGNSYVVGTTEETSDDDWDDIEW